MYVYADSNKLLKRSQIEDMNVAFGLRAEQEKPRNYALKKMPDINIHCLQHHGRL